MGKRKLFDLLRGKRTRKPMVDTPLEDQPRERPVLWRWRADGTWQAEDVSLLVTRDDLRAGVVDHANARCWLDDGHGSNLLAPHCTWCGIPNATAQSPAGHPICDRCLVGATPVCAECGHVLRWDDLGVVDDRDVLVCETCINMGLGVFVTRWGRD